MSRGRMRAHDGASPCVITAPAGSSFRAPAAAASHALFRSLRVSGTRSLLSHNRRWRALPAHPAASSVGLDIRASLTSSVCRAAPFRTPFACRASSFPTHSSPFFLLFSFLSHFWTVCKKRNITLWRKCVYNVNTAQDTYALFLVFIYDCCAPLNNKPRRLFVSEWCETSVKPKLSKGAPNSSMAWGKLPVRCVDFPQSQALPQVYAEFLILHVQSIRHQ